MGENCCICLPIECGVRTLAIVIILDALFTGAFWMTYPDKFETFWPFYSCTVVMACTFLYALFVNSEASRKHTFFVWVVIYLGVQLALYAYMIITGHMGSWKCYNGLEEHN